MPTSSQRDGMNKKTLKVLQGLNFNEYKDHYMKDLRPDDIVIPIMGPTGMNRRRKELGNDAMKVGHDLQSCTCQLDYTILHSSRYPELGVQGHHRIIILDAPGFDNTFETGYEILRHISVWLTHSRHEASRRRLLAWLSQTRMLGSTRKNFEMFQKLCGLKASPHIVLTMISSADLANEGVNCSLSIQQELVGIEKRLPETDSGRNLQTSLKEALESAKTMRRKLMYKDRHMENPRTDDLVIPWVSIIGLTGAEKSSLINTLIGNDTMKVGHDLQSCTCQLDYTILHTSRHPELGGHRRIIIVDTPGFDNTFETDYEILRRISVWLTHS
ncbi:hypothetical protein C8J56DRAFT_1081557 [Mycena floridula]|nr:hypothetical protein C8J56DRAFT_1081557 [Mycena floridula]